MIAELLHRRFVIDPYGNNSAIIGCSINSIVIRIRIGFIIDDILVYLSCQGLCYLS